MSIQGFTTRPLFPNKFGVGLLNESPNEISDGHQTLRLLKQFNKQDVLGHVSRTKWAVAEPEQVILQASFFC